MTLLTGDVASKSFGRMYRQFQLFRLCTVLGVIYFQSDT